MHSCVDGVWHLSSDDVQCLSIGCGILGSGGGGPPAMCKQLAIEGWLEGKHLKIYNPYHKRFVIIGVVNIGIGTR